VKEKFLSTAAASIMALALIGLSGAGNVETVKQQTMLVGTLQIDKMLENFSDNATWVDGPVPYGGVHFTQRMRSEASSTTGFSVC
jgi:hypothetical protein